MVKYWINAALLRVVIPGTFTACAVWRPTALSLIYLILMLISPFIPVPTPKTMKKSTGHYLKSCIALTLITGCIQFAFQIILLTVPSIWEKFTENCSLLEEIFRHIGLVRMDHAMVFEVFFWLIPEIAALPIMIIVYVFCRRFTSEEKKDPENTSIEAHLQPIPKQIEDKNIKIINFLGKIGTYIVLASLCYAASLSPSVEGGFYFLMFLGAATWWACNRELTRGFAVVCRILMAIVVVHITVLLSYQNQWPQEYIPVNGTWSRYFGLDAYYVTNCSDPRHTRFNPDNREWTQNGYAYSLRLFWLYYVLALQSQFLFKKPILKDDESTRLSQKFKNLDSQLSHHVSLRRRTPSQRWQSARRKAYTLPAASNPQPDERTPLMRFGSGRTGHLQDSTGSVIVQDGNYDDNIQMQSITEDVPEDRMAPIEHVIVAVYSIFQLFAHSSYLGTNIIMMTWSIMYHSWTTFVFLLWALILWMAPNKRSIMMKCSPFIVFYGTLLVLIGYIYSMNLTSEELPNVIFGVEMSEIGFPKGDSWHLVVKCGFMTMFWVTMRQYMAERLQAQQTSTLRDMVAPLHVSMSTAMHHETPEIKSQFMRDVGMVVKKLLTKFWIVVVAIMLFTSGITGERMTVFRIVYMMLFLFFLISFQLSWSAWRRMMYGFWIAVIVYSVVMLILVYTYQFKNFLEYWKYIHINERLQKDIGLEVYATKDLFVRLLTPTFFVIITVIQIHYFHDDFLESTNIENINVSLASKRESLTPPAATTSTVDVLLNSGQEPSTIFSLRQLKQMSKLERAAFFRKSVQQLKDFYNYFWLMLEIHMQKIIFISLMLLCLNDVCAINFIFVITIVIMMNFKRHIQIMGINGMSVAIAILMIAKMLYQIEYIDHSKWNINCTSEIPDPNNQTINHNKTFNIAEWIGMNKAKPGMLPDLLKGYIGIVTVTTLRAIITVRQCFYRYSRGESLETPQVMFPKIKRADADKGIAECLKFFLNYGFYKFGLEFCLIGIVILIGTRLDFYSVIYGVWLLILFAQTRRTAAKIWPFFRVFTIIMLIIEYACVVAPPTWLCIKYPWSANINLHEWMYFPDPEYPPNPRKLICDFFLLYMIIRQCVVFRVEAQCFITNTEFVAGHNYSVYKDMDKPNFINPVKDYVSHIHCWLDVVKRGSMMSGMWFTLSMMFLAGTNRTNLFSLGYLIGSFIFLWQGSDFYLRPVRVILRWWNYLIGYNVSVIFCKTILQGVGCVYIEELEAKACWLIQLLGIACLKKFDSSAISYDPHRCEVSREDIGMVWDGICFAFLIIQKRLFKSYYFFHIVDETKAMSILASRGAELLEDLYRKRIEFQETLDRAVLQKIKLKMDKIKADQLRIHGPSYKEPSSHKVGMAPLARTCSISSYVSSGHTPPQGYQTPIDEDDDEDIKNIQEEKKDEDPPPLTPRAASLLQAPSPNSAILTVSLDGYLEPTRISFGSPPSSDLNPRGASPDETFPVFSPPPYDPPPNSDQSCRSIPRDIHQRRQSSLAGITWTELPITPRQSISIASRSLRSPRSHQTYSVFPRDRPLYRQRVPKTNREAVRSGDYYMFDDFDDEDVTDLIPDSEMEIDEEEQRRQQRLVGRRMTVSELMSTLFKTDIEIATHVAMFGGTTKDALRLRRQSVPLSRKKSSMSYLSAQSDTETAAVTEGIDKRSSTLDGGQASIPEGKDEELDSHDEIDYTSSSTAGDKKDPTKRISLFTYFKFLIELINSSMISATKYLNKFSRDYRYIRKVLAKEKTSLKAKSDFRMGMRLGLNQIWQPIPALKERSETESNSSETTKSREELRQKSGSQRHEIPQWLQERLRHSFRVPMKILKTESLLTSPHIRILAPSLERGLDGSSSSSMLTKTQLPTSATEDEEEPELSEVDQPIIIQLLASIWFGILAHSTFVCYFMIFLHQIKNASVLSTPLPLMVFFWGSLTIPRPSKTFWVTIIAYTEAIVIIKCMFQLELISWGQNLPYNRPMETPRIIGVEKKHDYALWDLLLLLMVFFHRFMLKSLGQWTTPYATRKIIPSQIVIGTSKPSLNNGRGESTRLQWQNEDQKEFSRSHQGIDPVVDTSTDEVDMENQHQTDSDEERLVEIRNKDQKEFSRSHQAIDPVVGTSTDEVDMENQHQTDSDEDRLVEIRNEETHVCDTQFSTAVSMTAKKYCEPGKIFFNTILSPDGKEKTNVYAYMFLCDFFNFLLIIFGFSYFGTQQGDGGVKAYFEENRVPMPFLSMMLLQFGLIVIDRALYLRKSIFGKLIFHYVLVFGIHIWMFFVLPGVTGRQFSNNTPPQIWYIVKCFYLLLSAYQLRLGYPTRILGNFLCKNYSIINYCLFKVFMLVPFLFELRAVMDWIWTDTSMTVMDWFKMEDIFASIYQIKCMRGLESDFPQPRGIKKAQISKYMVGGGALFVIIGVIWFPLLLFALGGTVGMANIPSEVSLSIRIGSHEPIYTTSTQDSSIIQYNEEEFHTLRNYYLPDRAALTFLENYDPADVAVVKLSKSSQRIWGITPLEKEKLKQELLNNKTTIGVRVEWKVTRRSDAKDFSGISPTIRDIPILPFVNGEFNPVRTNLSKLLSADSPNMTDIFINLNNVFPKFLKVTSKSTAIVKQLMRSPDHSENYPPLSNENGQDTDYLYRNATLQLASDTGQQWWMVSERCDDAIYNEVLKDVPMNNCSHIVMFLFNDKVFPESLSFLSGFGILGLYTTGVILISQVIRRLVSDMASKIMFDDLPYVDRILRLCLDIYLVRESNELSLEEDLFAKLIFLYRSPETLIRWTRPPEPDDDDDGGGDSGDNDDGDNYDDNEDDSDDDDDDDDDVRVENQEKKKDK